MVRGARVVATGMPHHITQRGNRRQPTFCCAEDYQDYVTLMGSGVERVQWTSGRTASCPTLWI